jgi:hypothetical protein
VRGVWARSSAADGKNEAQIAKILGMSRIRRKSGRQRKTAQLQQLVKMLDDFIAWMEAEQGGKSGGLADSGLPAKLLKITFKLKGEIYECSSTSSLPYLKILTSSCRSPRMLLALKTGSPKSQHRDGRGLQAQRGSFDLALIVTFDTKEDIAALRPSPRA